MPLDNWIRITEDDDLRYVCKDPEDTKGVNLVEAWYKVNDDYIQRYGLGDLYKRLLKKMKEKALLQLDYIETRDRFQLNLIELAEQEMRAMMSNKGESIGIREALVHLSKYMGFRLNPKEITVNEFFLMRDKYGKENNKTRNSRK
jgi:hypothetical protein